MGSNFNAMILVDKLAKLSSSQQSIETLSHWCIFHMNKAKLVVKTWNKQFHQSPREQRLAYLYLANDIIQNSRRKGVDFATEFWKVLPDCLRDVIENGDEFGRNAAFRLINIWEERKVFGSGGQILKEEVLKRQLDDENRSWNHVGSKQRPPSAGTLDKLISGYENVNGLEQEEDVIYYKCRNAIIFVERMYKDIEVGHAKGTSTKELKRQKAILRGCIEKLTSVESSRANLVTLLRESLRVQEDKLDQIRNQLQVAQTHSDQADIICRQLLGGSDSGQIQTEQSKIESPAIQGAKNHVSGVGEQSISGIHGLAFSEKTGVIEEKPQSSASAIVAHLKSVNAAQVLSHGISYVTPGGISLPIKEPSSDYSSEKRARIENDHPYVPQYTLAPVPVFSHTEHVEGNLPVDLQDLNPVDPPPPPPSSPPPLPPLPPAMQIYQVPQYIHTPMPIPNGPYNYNMSPQFTEPVPSYSLVGPLNGVTPFPPPSNVYQPYPTENVFYSHPSSLPMAPTGHQ